MIALSISIIALASLLFSLVSLSWTKHRIRESRHALMLFDAQLYRRNEDHALVAEIWSVPEEFQCISGGDKTEGTWTFSENACT